METLSLGLNLDPPDLCEAAIDGEQVDKIQSIARDAACLVWSFSEVNKELSCEGHVGPPTNLS